MDDRIIGIPFPERIRDVSVLHEDLKALGPPSLLYNISLGLFPVAKATGE
jgi:hypothetical protein